MIAITLLLLSLGTGTAAAATPNLACDAGSIAELQRRFHDLPATAFAQRDEILLSIARCRYQEGRWREFFGLARYRRVFEPQTEASERLALLDVLGSLRHCRLDRAREVFAYTHSGVPALEADRKRISLALDTLQGNPTIPTKPTDKSAVARGVVEKAMHWPVSLDDEKIRQSDPFRFQVRVTSRCTGSEPTAPTEAKK